jgi:anti-sigma regulatory factor (Ser/Thr protein kinase)
VKAVIEDITQVIAFRSDVRDAVSRHAFTEGEREEILLALTEICTNLVRHGSGGIVEIGLPTEESPKLTIKSWNLAGEPPRGDSLDDQVLLGRGLRIGLASLDRLMDQADAFWDGVWFEVNCEKRLNRRSRN